MDFHCIPKQQGCAFAIFLLFRGSVFWSLSCWLNAVWFSIPVDFSGRFLVILTPGRIHCRTFMARFWFFYVSRLLLSINADGTPMGQKCHIDIRSVDEFTVGGAL
eukprot:RCo029072